MNDELTEIIKNLPPEQHARMRQRFGEDLEKSGARHVEAALKFQAGLEGVTNVMLNLVLNFGRASTLLLVIGAINTLCLLIMVVSTVQLLSVSSQIDDLLMKQETFSQSQKRLEKSTTESNEQVVKKVEEAKAKVDDVAESSPRVKVDARTGRAKLVVPGPSASPVKGKKYEIGLETGH